MTRQFAGPAFGAGTSGHPQGGGRFGAVSLYSGWFSGLRATVQIEPESAFVLQGITTVGAHVDHCEPATKCDGYFKTHRGRMRFREWSAVGLGVGSGVVEAGCKIAAVVRLKHWTVDRANAVLALRCSILSGRFEDSWAVCAAAVTGPFAGLAAALPEHDLGNGQDVDGHSRLG